MALVLVAMVGAAGSGAWQCPLAGVLGIPCITCGATRSTHALLALDFAEALRFNPLAPFGIPLFVATALHAVVLVYRTGRLRGIDDGRPGRALLSAWLVFWVVATAYWGLRFVGLFGGPCPV